MLILLPIAFDVGNLHAHDYVLDNTEWKLDRKTNDSYHKLFSRNKKQFITVEKAFYDLRLNFYGICLYNPISNLDEAIKIFSFLKLNSKGEFSLSCLYTNGNISYQITDTGLNNNVMEYLLETETTFLLFHIHSNPFNEKRQQNLPSSQEHNYFRSISWIYKKKVPKFFWHYDVNSHSLLKYDDNKFIEIESHFGKVLSEIVHESIKNVDNFTFDQFRFKRIDFSKSSDDEIVKQILRVLRIASKFPEKLDYIDFNNYFTNINRLDFISQTKIQGKKIIIDWSTRNTKISINPQTSSGHYHPFINGSNHSGRTDRFIFHRYSFDKNYNFPVIEIVIDALQCDEFIEQYLSSVK